MTFNGRKRKLGLATGIIAASLLLAACDDGSMNADLRVIHASDDAPPVNVRVGFKKLISDLDYAESSGYVAVRSGIKKVAVEAIIPGGNLNVIEEKRFNFEIDKRYNILAVNKTADIAPLVIEESATEPGLDEVAIVVVHAANVAGEVDIYLTGPNDSLDNPLTLDYKAAQDIGPISADESAEYRIRVALKGSPDPVYDSGPFKLNGFAGDKLLIAALNSENVTENMASPIKLLVANDIDQLVLLDATAGDPTLTAARVVHLSPDAGTAVQDVFKVATGAVEVFATSDALGGTAELIDAFTYTDVVPAVNDPSDPRYVRVPDGDYVFDVAPDTDSIDDSVYTSPNLSLSPGIEYSVIAAGNVLSDPSFGLLATADDNRKIVTQASVKVVHAAPLAGLVDVFVTPSKKNFHPDDILSGKAGKPLLKNFPFGDITDYVPLEPGNYDIRVVAGGAVAIDIEDFSLDAGLVATVIARQPDGDNDPADFGVVVLTN